MVFFFFFPLQDLVCLMNVEPGETWCNNDSSQPVKRMGIAFFASHRKPE